MIVNYSFIANGRIEGTNQLNNRVTDAVAPDGSSVILTPVQEGAVQSLRTMLQSGQTRGRPRLIGMWYENIAFKFTFTIQIPQIDV